MTQSFLASFAFVALLATGSALAAAEPIDLVPFNADDDDRDGLRDYEDDRLNGLPDLADMAIAPLPAGEGKATVTVVAPAGAVRVFWHENNDRMSTATAGEPLELPAPASTGGALLVEAARPRDAEWDGRFTIRIERDNGESTQTEMRVAPLLVRSSLAPAREVYIREFPERNETLVEQLGEFCRAAGAKLHVVPAGDPYEYNHIWLQDAIELLASEPGDGPFAEQGWSLSLSLAANRNRAIDLFPKDRLLGPGVGWIRVGEYREGFARGEGGVSWIDWYGNLEASPPTDDHPRGRVLYGVDAKRNAQMHPAVIGFLTAQEAQPPVPLDVGWLTIKHVDEMVSFMPAKEGGFLVAVPDPTAALEALRQVQQAGHGSTPMLGVYEEGVTVESLLADNGFVAVNERLWSERIEPMADKLLDALGVAEESLVRLPVLFHANGLPRTPNVVNCLVANGHVAMADPDGPIVDGRDALQAETRRRLADAALTIHFVDDRQYHKWSGNVHCATNALRPIEK